MNSKSLELDFGPRARVRSRIASAVTAALLLALLIWVVTRLDAAGEFDRAKWEIYLDGSGWPFILGGVVNSLKVAAADVCIAVPAGVLVCFGQLSRQPVIRRLSIAYAEAFRSLPTLLLILFLYFGSPAFGVEFGAFWSLVLGSALYNSAVLSNIFRSGIQSIERGQLETSYALGLNHAQAMRLVIAPQALRRVLPATVSQLIVLLKDSSLGFVIGFEELLRRSQQLGSYEHNFLQAYAVAGLLYFVACFGLSRLAHLLDARFGAKTAGY